MTRRQSDPSWRKPADGIAEFSQTLATLAKCAFLIFIFWMIWQCAFPSPRVAQAARSRHYEQVHRELLAANVPAAYRVVYSSGQTHFFFTQEEPRP